VRLLQAAVAAGSRNPDTAASTQRLTAAHATPSTAFAVVDRALFIWLYRRYPRILDAMSIVRPETVMRWHRKGFTGYWRWKSRSPGSRPRIAKEVRDLIRRMSFENSLWGATKIHGELLKLGIAVAQSTVSVYMVPRRDRPLQTWKTFLRNHMEGIASIDLFVVPMVAFQQLFAFLVLGHQRRQLLWFAVTRNPTAEWLARQITEAFIVGRFIKVNKIIGAECHSKRFCGICFKYDRHPL
jgi:hypothetical protein